MTLPRCVLVLGLVAVTAGPAAADTKIVQMTHQDAFTVMGQSQPAKDEEHVVWIGSDRMRVDQGPNSVLVRVDLNKVFFLDHDAKTSSTLDLPLDVSKYLPPGMGEQMLQMMQFEVEVNPSDETKKIGEWNTRRFDVAMKSAMVTVEATYWVTQDVKLDFGLFYELYEQVLAFQPGMKDLAEELKKIEGLVVEQEAVAKMTMMGDTSVNTSQTTVSIEEADPTAGTYDSPADYTDKPFDFMAMMQQRQEQ
jgi:hypothetical protein